ncbi:MAG: winged helix-turn-helix transcriptional regulator [Methylococcaceae bacterium]|nr:winged helix-turn-helix transcriptional regulator [Methylococcaceae bacterium]
MKTTEIYEYLERISNLLRTDIRKGGISLGLQPVQLEALNYLYRCNRYSNSPVAVAEFLGLTKGTVSQTLAVLENSGLIEKHPDQKDRRVVHLELTDAGRRVVAECIPPKVLRQAAGELSGMDQEALLQALTAMLTALQHANRLRSFGVCKNCRHHALRADGSRHCRLTGEDLSELDSGKICREHDSPPTVPSTGG